jgi:hypothetical protein
MRGPNTETKLANRGVASRKWNWRATCLLATIASLIFAGVAIARPVQYTMADSDFQLSWFGALPQVWYFWLGPLCTGIGGVIASGYVRASSTIDIAARCVLWLSSVAFACLVLLGIASSMFPPDLGDLAFVLAALAGLAAASTTIAIPLPSAADE